MFVYWCYREGLGLFQTGRCADRRRVTKLEKKAKQSNKIAEKMGSNIRTW
jgi:hypothetical protein